MVCLSTVVVTIKTEIALNSYVLVLFFPLQFTCQPALDINCNLIFLRKFEASVVLVEVVYRLVFG